MFLFIKKAGCSNLYPLLGPFNEDRFFKSTNPLSDFAVFSRLNITFGDRTPPLSLPPPSEIRNPGRYALSNNYAKTALKTNLEV